MSQDDVVVNPEAIATVVSMGFSVEEAMAALKVTRNAVELAVELLVSGALEETPAHQPLAPPKPLPQGWSEADACVIRLPHGQYSSSCGYCHNGRNTNYAFRAMKLTPAVYEQLLNRDWCRSGNFIYHPVSKLNCCPYYQHCLDTTLYERSRSDARLIRRWQSFVDPKPLSQPIVDDAGSNDDIKSTERLIRTELETVIKQLIEVAMKRLTRQACTGDHGHADDTDVGKPLLSDSVVTNVIASSKGIPLRHPSTPLPLNQPLDVHPRDAYLSGIAHVLAAEARRQQAQQPEAITSVSCDVQQVVRLLCDSCSHVLHSDADEGQEAMLKGVVSHVVVQQRSSVLSFAIASGWSDVLSSRWRAAVNAVTPTDACVDVSDIWNDLRGNDDDGGVDDVVDVDVVDIVDVDAAVDVVDVDAVVDVLADDDITVITSTCASPYDDVHMTPSPSSSTPNGASTRSPSSTTPTPGQSRHVSTTRWRSKLGIGATDIIDWQVEVLPSEYREEAFQLYKRYQMAVHNDEEDKVTPESYIRFLVTTPLVHVPASHPDHPPHGFGSFHVHYRLNGELIGVAVRDVLPETVDSVYFFWDTTKRFLNLGRYTALEEIDFVRATPCLRYYMLGWHVHTCSKMNYKITFRPSYLLCPETHTWQFYHNVRERLDLMGYARLADDDVPNVHQDVERDAISHIPARLDGVFMQYAETEALLGPQPRLNALLQDYIKYIGRDLAERIIVIVRG